MILFLCIFFVLVSFVISNTITTKGNYEEVREFINTMDNSDIEYSLLKIENFDVPTYLKSKNKLFLVSDNEKTYNDVTEKNIFFTDIGKDIKVTLTFRFFSEEDKLIMIRVENDSNDDSNIEFIQLRKGVQNHTISRYDRFPIVQNEDESFGDDLSTYPIGVEVLTDNHSIKSYRMIGKTFNSKRLSLEYSKGDQSALRDFQSEVEAYNYREIDGALVSSHSLKSLGRDITETWWIDTQTPLFNGQESMDSWMKETSENSRLRNMWYTVDGPLNKMASAVEPIPKSGQGFGRLLLLMKDDRALDKYKETKEHYFYILLKNSYVDLTKYKGNRDYWETEVTSTWLKRLYGMNAPFIDTRFNELIALFIYESGIELGNDNFKSGIKDYADLLVLQAKKNNVIYSKKGNGFYIQDYFSVNQEMKTHSSLNHLLGGLNILLLAYKEFGEEEYLDVASKILIALEEDKNHWIREDTGDLWYQVSIDRIFQGNDYQHLTMSDLVYSYQLLKAIDENSEYLKTIDFLLGKKFKYLDSNNLGTSVKLRQRLKEIDRLDYIPAGPELIDGK